MERDDTARSGEDREAEAFFEALAGRRAAPPVATALREALQARERTLREAEAARAGDMTPEEQARMDSLKLRLIAAGAFRPAPAPPPRPGLAARLRAWMGVGAWQGPVAVAAGLVLASVLVLRLGPLGEDPEDTLRGAPSSVITVPDPQARAEALAGALRPLGAEVLVVPINAAEWSLVVSVPDAARLPAVQARLREAGFAAEGAPPYELSLRRQR